MFLKKKKEAAIKLYESIPGNKYLITLAKLQVKYC